MIVFDPDENVGTSKADLLVNTVNTIGVMGAGVARAIRERFPSIMEPYQERCRTGALKPGGIQVLRIPDGPVVVNLASKQHFKDPSKPDWVGLGLINLNRLLSLPAVRDVETVALPPPGAGLGGLSPETVQRMIRAYVPGPADREVRITVCAREAAIRSRPIIYAGVGSRETPEDVKAVMTEVAEGLADESWTLRSGNAIGADLAFERGAPVALKESYLPWPKDGVPHGIVNITTEHNALMRSTYRSPFGERWSPKMSRSSTLLMTRNGNQVFGQDFTEPSDMVICWTPDGAEKGGTRQAIALANLVRIPVLNLGLPEWEGASAQRVIAEAKRLVAQRREDMGIALPSDEQGPRP